LPISDVTDSQSKSMAADFLLAVDAGGTKTTAWLVDVSSAAANQVLGCGRSTGGNPLSVGFDDATRAIVDAVAQAHSTANRPVAQVGRIIMSIAGSADQDVREKLVAWAHATKLAHQVAIVSDFLPVLAAGTPDCRGVALISGTGSSAFARNADGRMARCGGWGYLLGDEGSGFAIGRAALKHTLDALELQLSPDALAQTVLNLLDANSVSDLTRVVYSSDDLRARIAAVAPLVVAAAEHSDSVAGAILDAAACDLANLAIRAARVVNLAEDHVTIAVSGSVLVNAMPLRDRLDEKLRELGLDCTIAVVDEPLQGCVRLAAPEFVGKLVVWQDQ
jgi:N-acetylglucosamine kinase-like BadF-type ATPase